MTICIEKSMPIDSSIENEYAANGFQFDLAARNLALQKCGVKPPGSIKTGTTIVAAVHKNGIVLGADSRATGGNIVADKHCVKVHYITDCIYACGAGTAADLDQVCRMLQSHLKLYELNNAPKKAPVCAAVRKAKQHLFRHQGHVGAYLLIGGVDAQGSHLYSVAAHGSTTKMPYNAEGSGSLAAISVLEKEFKFEQTEEECIALVSKALEAGMHGDNASGNSFRLTVVSNDFKHRIVEPQFPKFAVKPDANDLVYAFAKGTTVTLPLPKKIAYKKVAAVEEEKMDTA